MSFGIPHKLCLQIFRRFGKIEILKYKSEKFLGGPHTNKLVCGTCEKKKREKI